MSKIQSVHIEAEEVLRMLRDTSDKARAELNEIRQSLQMKQGGWTLFIAGCSPYRML